MTTPSGHLLSLTVLRVGDDYTSRCRCGIDVYGRTLPELWENHDEHLAVVKAQSMRNHPSSRREDV